MKSYAGLFGYLYTLSNLTDRMWSYGFRDKLVNDGSIYDFCIASINSIVTYYCHPTACVFNKIMSLSADWKMFAYRLIPVFFLLANHNNNRVHKTWGKIERSKRY